MKWINLKKKKKDSGDVSSNTSGYVRCRKTDSVGLPYLTPRSIHDLKQPKTCCYANLQAEIRRLLLSLNLRLREKEIMCLNRGRIYKCLFVRKPLQLRPKGATSPGPPWPRIMLSIVGSLRTMYSFPTLQWCKHEGEKKGGGACQDMSFWKVKIIRQ